jgi:hypothetical protein
MAFGVVSARTSGQFSGVYRLDGDGSGFRSRLRQSAAGGPKPEADDCPSQTPMPETLSIAGTRLFLQRSPAIMLIHPYPSPWGRGLAVALPHAHALGSRPLRLAPLCRRGERAPTRSPGPTPGDAKAKEQPYPQSRLPCLSRRGRGCRAGAGPVVAEDARALLLPLGSLAPALTWSRPSSHKLLGSRQVNLCRK